MCLCPPLGVGPAELHHLPVRAGPHHAGHRRRLRGRPPPGQRGRRAGAGQRDRRRHRCRPALPRARRLQRRPAEPAAPPVPQLQSGAAGRRHRAGGRRSAVCAVPEFNVQ